MTAMTVGANADRISNSHFSNKNEIHMKAGVASAKSTINANLNQPRLFTTNVVSVGRVTFMPQRLHVFVAIVQPEGGMIAAPTGYAASIGYIALVDFGRIADFPEGVIRNCEGGSWKAGTRSRRPFTWRAQAP